MRDFGTLLRCLQRLCSVAILIAVIASTSFLNQGMELKIPKSQRTRVKRSARHRQLPGISHASGVMKVCVFNSCSPTGAATLPRREIASPNFLASESVTSSSPENPHPARTIRVVLPRPPPNVS